MRIIVIITIVVCLLALPAFAKRDKGHLSVTAKASIYDPPGDAGITPMITVEANYNLSKFIVAVGSVSWTSYDNTTFVPVTAAGELHPLGSAAFDPYAGAGLSANYRRFSASGLSDTDLTLGLEFFGGIAYHPGGMIGFEGEAKYRIEDIAHAGDSGSWSLGGGITGSWEKDL
jgi:hypothetical protein